MAPKTSQIPVAAEIGQALALLEERLAATPRTQELVAVTVECEPCNQLEWLARAEGTTRTYWRGREGHLEIAGCGAAVEVIANQTQQFESAFARMNDVLAKLHHDVEARWLGGICYDPQRHNDNLWSGFPQLWFVLPQISLTRRRDKYSLTLAVRRGDKSALSELEQQLIQAFDDSQAGASTPSPEIIGRVDLPGESDWHEILGQAHSEMANGQLDKVVLARRSDLQLREPLEPTSFAESLRIANGSGYTFMLQPESGSAFVGAPPERLFKLTGNTLATEAIAGTRPAGKSDSEAQRYADELLHSAKDSAEHGFVVEAIRKSLEPLCTQVESDPQPEIMRLGTVQHLRLPISGKLKLNLGVHDLLEAMHPTPAVGGSPREEALHFIRQNEPFARGWYAAPVGYIGRDACEFAVAIRSALLQGNKVSLFAGAGIVAASDPALEWRELEQKIVAPSRVLGESE